MLLIKLIYLSFIGYESAREFKSFMTDLQFRLQRVRILKHKFENSIIDLILI